VPNENTSRSSIQCWLALKLVSRLAIHKKIKLVASIGIKSLFSQTFPHKSLIKHGLSSKQISMIKSPNWHKVDEIIASSALCKSRILTFDDPLYSDLLKQIYDPPLVLFVQGNPTLINQSQLAIVGSRGASFSGLEFAFKISSQLVNENLIVTSGLALGIDGQAHKGALAIEKKTIAVVATGLDQVYPKSHRQLANKILSAGGAIVSEFIPGTTPRPGHFPKRNRIISGLSLGVLVVEATLKSGSLITARSAIEQNRDVFAVPSSLSNPQGEGCHWLIQQGAKLVTQCADIVCELDFSDQPSLNLRSEKDLTEKSQTNKEKSINKDLFIDPLLASVGYETTPVDVVVSRSELPIEEVLTRLTMLELKGVVCAVPGGYLRLNRG